MAAAAVGPACRQNEEQDANALWRAAGQGIQERNEVDLQTSDVVLPPPSSEEGRVAENIDGHEGLGALIGVEGGRPTEVENEA